ncbi:capsular polysaccharide biosynthesis protein [Phaeobacter sp. CNT1-3]|nr:capsular polysaccharide biosynthesis protein [Phaeobacter sp. CNT1-3]
MAPPDWIGFEPAGIPSRRVAYFNAGFLRQKRLRRILELAGYDLRLTRPEHAETVAVWGHSPYAARGEAVVAKTGADLIRVEDAFLRSLHPGRSGEPPLGLVVCKRAMHFDITQPNDLEQILNEHPLDDAGLLTRARDCIARINEVRLSKYAAFDPDAPLPDAGYVLLVDQARGDASIKLGRANQHSFAEMLMQAREDHPAARIVIKTHPETRAGHRTGHFADADLPDNVTLYDGAASPHALLEGAVAVYTVTSGLGFEAIMAGHRPKVFGQPFYAGWGLTDDISPLPRRSRTLTRAQLFAGAMMLYPIWYDPYRDRLCRLEDVIDTLEAQSRAYAADLHGWQASGMRLWKRKALNGFFGQVTPMQFTKTPQATTRKQMIWAREAERLDTPPPGLVRVEDGFLRSRGLGAALVPPLSLVTDHQGIYYDPSRPSDLEDLIRSRAHLREDQRARADRLRRALIKAGLSKYNLGAAAPDLPEGHRILVPGQVEDDASIRLGTSEVQTNLALLAAAREANPEATILYKPHPDVEAGLRPGALSQDEVSRYADAIIEGGDPAALLTEVQEVWTMTSLLGFEALLRGVKVTCLGTPFYAGWGLTVDRGAVPSRRNILVPLEGLIHATLIDYPRYRDPVTGLPCPAEVVVERLAAGISPAPPSLRMVAKLQGLLSSYAHLWRR